MNPTPDSTCETTRLCPACPDRRLRKLTPTKELTVDYCDGCGGLWCDRGEADALRQQNVSTSSWTADPSERRSARCRGCGCEISRNDSACAGCARPNVLDCPACCQPMEIATHKGVRLDVCRMCVGVWFDTTEFVATEGGGLFGVAPAYTGTKDAAWNGAAEAGIELLVEGILGWFFDS